jgi:predicted nucleic acid-binding Zn ribbon protein
MPTYVYREILADGSDGELLEIDQPMSAPALKTHPLTGRPVRRVYQATAVSSKYTLGSTKKITSDQNVAKHGFTKYVRDKQTGGYHKTVGNDPRAPDTFKQGDF